MKVELILADGEREVARPKVDGRRVDLEALADRLVAAIDAAVAKVPAHDAR